MIAKKKLKTVHQNLTNQYDNPTNLDSHIQGVIEIIERYKI